MTSRDYRPLFLAIAAVCFVGAVVLVKYGLPMLDAVGYRGAM